MGVNLRAALFRQIDDAGMREPRAAVTAPYTLQYIRVYVPTIS